MADERDRQRTPQEAIRELQQRNPEAAKGLDAEIAQAGETLRSAMRSAQTQTPPSFEEQVREAGRTLSPHVMQTKEASLDSLGTLSPGGSTVDQEQPDDEAISSKERWLAQIAKEPEPMPEPEPAVEKGRDLNRDAAER